jgi:hypothetical protein
MLRSGYWILNLTIAATLACSEKDKLGKMVRLSRRFFGSKKFKDVTSLTACPNVRNTRGTDPRFPDREPSWNKSDRRCLSQTDEVNALNASHTMPTLVMVHGAWADGSSWSRVIRLLQPTAWRPLRRRFR